jgi:hypothetical protein
MSSTILATDEIVGSTHQVSTTLGDEVVMLELRESMYYGLDGVGARVWALVQAPIRFDALVTAISTEYAAPATEVAADLQALMTDLQSRGLVEIRHAAAS